VAAKRGRAYGRPYARRSLALPCYALKPSDRSDRSDPTDLRAGRMRPARPHRNRAIWYTVGMSLEPEIEPAGGRFKQEEIETFMLVLQHVANYPSALRRDDRFKGLISKIYKETKRDENRDERWRRQTQDRAIRAEAAMVRIQRDAVSAASLQAAIP